MQKDVAQEFNFTWKIKNFNLCMLENGQTLISSVFVADTLKLTSWSLEIFMDDNKNYLSIFLHRQDNGKENLNINFKFKLINSNGDVIKSKLSTNRTFTSLKSWGWNEFCKTEELKSLTECLNGSIISEISFLCSLGLQDSIVKLNSKYIGWTKFAVDRSCFRWNIEEIDSNYWITSKIFPCSSLVHIEIVLTAPDDFLSIFVKKLVKGNSENYYVYCKLSLLDLKLVEQDSRISEHLFKRDDENDIWQFPNFLQKSKLQDEKCKYLKNGTFTLLCEFCVSEEKSLDYIEKSDNNDLVEVYAGIKEDPVNILQEDLQRMFTNHLKTDVNLRAESQTFQAHKCLLSARSPVFAAMFEKDMMENQTGVVNIADIDAEVLEHFLKFMYTGTVDDIDYELASKLLIAADKYQVPSLKKKCSSFLMLNLSKANVCDVVVLSNLIGDKILETYAADYIVAHSDVLVSEDWSRCIHNDAELAGTIFQKLKILH